MEPEVDSASSSLEAAANGTGRPSAEEVEIPVPWGIVA
ncbi:hypothetical protein pipiens_018991, partial [Culex pipiens pipiens]